MAQLFEVTDSAGLQTAHSAAPTVGNARANWATPTVTAASGDTAGLVGATSSGTPPGAGAAIDVTFSAPYASPPRSIVMSGALQPYATGITASGFTVTVGTAPAASTTYTWAFQVVP